MSKVKSTIINTHQTITCAEQQPSLLLIWLNHNINENNDDYQNTIIQLQHVVNTIHIFTDSDKCVEFIKTIHHENICLIVSGSLGQYVTPYVHDLSQIDSIFILCNDKKKHEQWTLNWAKIKGVFADIAPICERLMRVADQCEYNSISLSFIPVNENMSKKNLDQLDCSFMYTQILKEILLTIDFEKKHIDEFIVYCRQYFADNDIELKNITKFEQTYRYQTPIWWYTYECFLYRMLNHALRMMDIDIIVKMGFFVVDLHHHIEYLYNKQSCSSDSNKIFTVYRGQSLSKIDFDRLINTKGGLMAINNFLSTSKDRNVSINFAYKTFNNSDMVRILFVIIIDPLQSRTPFASITEVGCYKHTEDEVLFSMHTVFRIGNIKLIDENQQFYQVDLRLTSDKDKDLCKLTEIMRKEAEGTIGWFRLGVLLRRMGQFEKAERVYQMLLEQTVDDKDKGSIYDRLGKAKEDQGEYQQAIELYKKAIDIQQKTLPNNHLSLATSYNNIGVVHENMGQYLDALSYHEKALKIKEATLPLNHPSLSASYTNIGVVYRKTGDHSKAFFYHEKSLEIKQQSYPPNHPDLAKCYINHGIIYAQIDDYEKALSFFKKAFDIQQKSLPIYHPDFILSYNNMAIVYRKLGEYSKALSFNEKVLEIQNHSLSSTHPRLIKTYNNIALLHKTMNNYEQALIYYEKMLEIQQQSSNSNPSDLVKSHCNIGRIYNSMCEYSKALSTYEKALEIQHESFPSDHLNFSPIYNDIGITYKSMGDFSSAYPSFERAINIAQRSLPPNHPTLQGYRNNLESTKEKL